jgi:hypothetical protein
MKPKDMFSLAVRILGLAFLYQGLLALPTALRFGLFVANFGNLIAGLLSVGWPLGVAYWLLRGAPLLMRIAYPETDERFASRQGIGTIKGEKADP